MIKNVIKVGEKDAQAIQHLRKQKPLWTFPSEKHFTDGGFNWACHLHNCRLPFIVKEETFSRWIKAKSCFHRPPRKSFLSGTSTPCWPTLQGSFAWNQYTFDLSNGYKFHTQLVPETNNCFAYSKNQIKSQLPAQCVAALILVFFYFVKYMTARFLSRLPRQFHFEEFFHVSNWDRFIWRVSGFSTTANCCQQSAGYQSTYLPTYLPKYNTNKLLRVLIRHSMNPIFDESQTVS